MAHGINPMSYDQLPQTAAAFEREEAGRGMRVPLISKEWRNSAVLCNPRTAATLPQNCRKLPQQRGLCGSPKDPPKGGFLDDKCRTSPVRLQNCRSNNYRAIPAAGGGW